MEVSFIVSPLMKFSEELSIELTLCWPVALLLDYDKIDNFTGIKPLKWFEIHLYINKILLT